MIPEVGGETHVGSAWGQWLWWAMASGKSGREASTPTHAGAGERRTQELYLRGPRPLRSAKIACFCGRIAFRRLRSRVSVGNSCSCGRDREFPRENRTLGCQNCVFPWEIRLPAAQIAGFPRRFAFRRPWRRVWRHEWRPGGPKGEFSVPDRLPGRGDRDSPREHRVPAPRRWRMRSGGSRAPFRSTLI